MSEWQPIGTAPRSGVEILAYQRGEYFNCHWHDYGNGEFGWMDSADSEPNPTHWQPLPEPPSE